MATLVTTKLDFSTNGAGIINLADPVAATDASNKRYVDMVAQGLSPKPAAVVATTAALPTNTYNNGTNGAGASLTATGNGAFPAVDGVTLNTIGQRILVKNEGSVANNGLYTLSQVGSGSTPWILTRDVDVDTATKIPGAYMYIESGSVNANTQYAVSGAGPFTVGTTAINFVQISGAITITAGTGITVTGTQVSLTTPVALANGGTNATTAAAARASIGAQAVAPSGAGSAGVVSIAAGALATGVSAVVGDGAATTMTINHNLGTSNVVVMVRNTATGAQIICDVTVTSANVVTLGFPSAPAASAYTAVILAIGV